MNGGVGPVGTEWPPSVAAADKDNWRVPSDETRLNQMDRIKSAGAPEGRVYSHWTVFTGQRSVQLPARRPLEHFMLPSADQCYGDTDNALTLA